MQRAATASGGRLHQGHRWTEEIWHRVRSEFMELPGMSLEVEQAARLFGIDRREAQFILEELVTVGFPRRTAIGAFARNDSRP